MREALATAGWGNYPIPLAGDGLSVGYLATGDYRAALGVMSATDVNRRRQAYMAGFSVVADGPPGRSFTRLEEIFT